jgi:oxygen-independent coproporphyrinogen III oxidase
VVRGLALTRDDLVRRAVIMALMCQGRVEFESIELAHLIKMREYFAAELEACSRWSRPGWWRSTGDGVQVTATGWYFVRGVAMVFDRHLQADRCASASRASSDADPPGRHTRRR